MVHVVISVWFWYLDLLDILCKLTYNKQQLCRSYKLGIIRLLIQGGLHKFSNREFFRSAALFGCDYVNKYYV